MLTPPAHRRLQDTLYRLVVQRCTGCRSFFLERRRFCRDCGGRQIEKAETCGHGTLVTYSTVYRAPTSHADFAPYHIGLVELDEKLRILARLVDSDDWEKGDEVEMVTRRLISPDNPDFIYYGYTFRRKA